ncbi:hypothetical protein GCM10009799_36600 [Nocardiopsis rhodophaea]|uniref:Spore-associated protein A n=1 Tax=Nocardiopsis rhodophaea TaxID=280238 RepID=A0ABP5ERI6_9ACTN
MKKFLATLGAAGTLLTGALAFATPAEAASNPYGPKAACGSGYVQVDKHTDRGSVVYLMYNGSSNCVATIKTSNIGRATDTFARLDVKDYGTFHDSGDFKYYAAVKAPAKNTCVKWGGGQGTAWVSPSWGHCG